MGVILDSTILVAAERSGEVPRKIFDKLIDQMGDTMVALSVITVAELAHGIERADSAMRRRTRERFLEDLNEISVEPITVAIAFRAGKLDGKLHGQRVALNDLLIGSTALELGYAVATHNVRHLSLIPDLEVRQV
jgi:predicted nucleic acid-binding protein